MKVTVAHSFSSFIYHIFPLFHQLVFLICSSTSVLFTVHKASEPVSVPSPSTCHSASLRLLITQQVVACILKARHHPGALALRFFFVFFFPPQRLGGCVCLCHRGKKSTEGSCTCAAWWLSLDSTLHITAAPRMSDLTEATSVPHMPAQTCTGPDRQQRRQQLTAWNL